MPDIDSLQISITSSTQGATTSINSLIRKLGELNGALNNYAADSQYIKGFNGLVTGLTGISNAVKSIDIEKLKNLSTTLGTLASSGAKLSKLNFVQSFSELGSEVQRTNTAISNTARSIAKEFHIPKDEMGSLTNSVKKLYSATNESTFNEASRELELLAGKYAKVEGASKELQEQFKAEQREFTSVKKYVSSDLLSNYGDMGKSNKGRLNIRNTTSNMEEGVDLVTLANENQMLADNEYEAMQKMVQLSEAASDSSARMNAQQEAIYNLNGRLEELRTKILGVKEAATTIGSEGEMLSGGFDPFGDDLEVDAAKARTSIENVGNAVENLRSEMNVEITNPFEGLITGLDSLKNLEIPAEKFAGVTNLAASLSKFGGKNAQNAITVIPQVGRSFAQMAAELAKAPQISENLVRLAEALSTYSRSAQNAASSSTTFGKAVNILHTAFGGLHMPARRTHKSFTSLASVFGRLYANFFLLIRGARALGRAMDYSSSMTEAANVVSVVFGSQSDVLDKFAETAIKDFGMAKLSATQFASRFQAMGKTMGITSEQIVKANDYIANRISGNERAYRDLGNSVADMSINLTKLTADIASLYNQDYADVAADMQSIYTGMTRPLRKYGLDLTQATLKEWAMSQGLDSNIEKMTQAQKTMLRYQYVMANASNAMGDFQKTADTFANAMRTTKQYLQEVARTLGEALINAIQPALLAFRNFLADFLVMAQNALNALGKLMGWHKIDFGGAMLTEDMEGYADAIDDAAGAAKKLKGQLRGIDELNNLTTNKGGGGGAGGLDGLGIGAEDLWDKLPKSDELYESTVKDWYDFGKRISDAIKNGLDSIDWQGIYYKFNAFGANLANFLNGLIQPETFASVGRTIANSLNAAIGAVFNFGKEFNFRNLGISLAESINSFFRNFDFVKLAQTINIWVDGFFKFLAGFFKGDEEGNGGLDFGAITKAFEDFFGTLDWKGWAGVISAGLVAAAPIIGAAISGLAKLAWMVAKEPLEKLFETTIMPEITAFFETIMANPAGLVRMAGKFAKGLITAIFAAIGGYTIGNGLGESIALLMGDFDLAEEYENKSLLSIMGIDMDLWEETWFEYFDDIKSGWSDIINWFNENPLASIFLTTGDGEALREKIGGVFDGIKEKVNKFKEDSGKALEDWWNNDVSPVFDLPKWTGLVSTIKESISQVWSEAVTFWTTEVPKWWTDNVAPWFTIEKWTELVSSIKESIEAVWNETVAFWTQAVPQWFEQDVKPFFTKDYWVGFLTGIKDAFSQIWDDAKQLAKGFFNSIADFAENFINGAIDGFGALATAKGILSEVNIDFNIPHIKIPRFAQGGYPSTGSLFWAGEAGAEMIGSMNGKTAVASNGEITGIISAIQQTSSAEMELLRQQNSLLQGILEKEFGISNDDLFRSVRNSARDFTNRTGNPAF